VASWRPLLTGIVCALTLAGATAAAQAPRPAPRPSPAQGQAPGQADRQLDRFIGKAGPTCLKAPARVCVDQGFAYADRDRSGGLSLAEAKAVEAQATAWSQANARYLPPAERQRLIMGLLVVQSIGPERLFASYDSDHNGELSKAELLADVRLDERPLPVVLSDPKSVDWGRLSERAGPAAPLIRRLFAL
jgi:hypothetical protein